MYDGVPQDDLQEIYKCVVCLVLDFVAVAYHSLLAVKQSDLLERLQRCVLKVIYGWTVSYRTILENKNIETLAERRVCGEICPLSGLQPLIFPLVSKS